MRSDDINEVYKAKLYAKEAWRIKIRRGEWTFHGDNNEHLIQLTDGHLSCDCEDFHRKPHGEKSCAHTRAIEAQIILSNNDDERSDAMLFALQRGRHAKVVQTT